MEVPSDFARLNGGSGQEPFTVRFRSGRSASEWAGELSLHPSGSSSALASPSCCANSDRNC